MRSHTLDDGASMRAELEPLDPDRDPRAEARFAAAVAARLDAVREGRSLARIPVDPLYGLWSLPRPLLLAASIIAVLLVGVASNARDRATGAPATIAESIGVPLQLLATGAPHR